MNGVPCGTTPLASADYYKSWTMELVARPAILLWCADDELLVYFVTLLPILTSHETKLSQDNVTSLMQPKFGQIGHLRSPQVSLG